MRIFGVFLAIVVGGCNCGQPKGDYWGHVKENPDPTHLHWCNSGEPQWLDPALTTSTTGIKLVYAMWDGLTRFNLDGLPETSIATRWDISEDQRTFTFHLRDDAIWSNTRPITAHDFRYHIIRILHPLTASNNTDPHWKLKNGKAFTENKIRVMLRDVGPFEKGDIVEVIEPEGTPQNPAPELVYSNVRKSSEDLALRDFPGFWDFCKSDSCRMEEPYRTVPAGTEVTIIDTRADDEGTEWAYVYWLEGEGVYGWVPMSLLDIHEHADFVYTVRKVARTRVPGLRVPMDEIDAANAEEQPEGTIEASDALMLPEAVGVRVVDDHTLVLETTGPIPYMIDMSPQRAYRPSPREAVSRRPLSWSQPRHGVLITSGPFTMTEWRVRDYVRLKKSPTYWDAGNVRLETITAYSMNDQAASANYYFQGSCDANTSNNIPSSYKPLLMEGGYKDFTAAPYLGIYIYLINTEKFPNRHFRRALAMSVDRSTIPDFLHGGEIPSSKLMPGTPIEDLSEENLEACGVSRDHPGVASVMLSGELCYVPPMGLEFDLEQAKKELALAKKQMGDDFSTSFSLKFNSGVEGHKLVAEYVQQQWAKNLGLDVSLEVQEWKTFLADTNHGEYDVARMGWILNFPDAEADLLPQFRCGAPDNRTEYCSKEFEKWFEEAEKTFDRRKRLEYIKKAEKTLVEDAPIIPFYVYTQSHLQKPYVKDLAINPPNQVPFHRAWIDPDWKTNRESESN